MTVRTTKHPLRSFYLKGSPAFPKKPGFWTVIMPKNMCAGTYNAVAGFSSRGPQDYGDPVNGAIAAAVAQRAAVDIAAPGTNLTSAFYGGQTGGNDASLAGSVNTPGTSLYSGGRSGTSYAAPITAAGVALMNHAAIANTLPADSRDGRVVKANLLNAARKIPLWDNGQAAHPNGNGGVRTTQALDFDSGAGALDLDHTYDQYLNGQTDLPGLGGGATAETIGWDFAQVQLSGQTDVTITSTVEAGEEFRATLAWFRERTHTSAAVQTDVGFANLDLEIWDGTFTTMYSDSISTYTPVEHVAFSMPVTVPTLGVRVTYPGNVFGNLTTEQYGLAWWVVPEPSSFILAAFALLGLVAYARRLRT